jgi:hypothetical protein
MRSPFLVVGVIGLGVVVLVIVATREPRDVAAEDARTALVPETEGQSATRRDPEDALGSNRTELSAVGAELPAAEAAPIAETLEALPPRSPAEEEAHFKWLRATLPKDELRAEHQKLVQHNSPRRPCQRSRVASPTAST